MRVRGNSYRKKAAAFQRAARRNPEDKDVLLDLAQANQFAAAVADGKHLGPPQEKKAAPEPDEAQEAAQAQRAQANE